MSNISVQHLLERLMDGTLKTVREEVSIEDRTITNFRFADGIDGLAGQEQELVSLMKHLDETSTAYRLGGLVVKASTSRAEVNLQLSRVRITLATGFFSGSNHTSDLKKWHSSGYPARRQAL